MFQLFRPSELAPVDFGPLLVQTAVGLFLELHLAIVRLPGGDLDVNVCVVGIAVERGDGASFREVLCEMLAHHLLRFLIAHFSVEGVEQAIMRPEFALPLTWLRQLIFFKLAHILMQINRAFFVARILVFGVGILRDILCPDALLLLLRRPLARDVADVCASAPAVPDTHGEDDAHRLSSPAISPMMRSTCCIARSRYACEYSL